jgi:hypothetical protein
MSIDLSGRNFAKTIAKDSGSHHCFKILLTFGLELWNIRPQKWQPSKGIFSWKCDENHFGIVSSSRFRRNDTRESESGAMSGRSSPQR